MDPLPTGTVTMLFSDVEGSTALLSRLGDRYGEALSAQRRIVRAGIEAWSGHEMGTEGDSFFVVFESAQHAVAACVQMQRALTTSTWPQGAALRVRMGLHTGEPTRHEEGYVGIDLNRAARIAATAHGGQVVLSSVTAHLVASRLPDGARLVDLGWHGLKDIDEPEHIFGLSAPDLPGDFPPLKSLGARSSLPTPATPLVGRDDEVRDLHEALSDPGARLVTLTGTGGVGKTRLALAVAASLDVTFRDGMYFVPLAAVDDAEAMWRALGDAVGAGADVPAERAVPAHLAPRRVLLVLDNLEQLGDAADVIASVLAGAPQLVVLATSRRPMHLRGEREYLVLPLAGPTGTTLESISGSYAVRLFVQQATLVQPAFVLTLANAQDVTSICRRLDGLPLAIELAASRVKLLPPKALLSRLDHSLDLVATDVDRPSRQQTLRATIAWSHDLMAPDLERAFRRMAVFAGGCDLDAVEAVTGDPATTSPGSGALEIIGNLLDLSMVTATETADGDVRISMLETIKEFAHDQLVDSGELEETRRRHAEYYADFAEQARGELHGSRQLSWLDRLEIEHDNLRAALSWTLDASPAAYEGDQQRPALGLRLVNALSWFWYGHSHTSDGRRWLELALERAPAEDGPALALAMHGLGVLLLQEGEFQRGRDLLEQNVRAWRRLGDDEALAKGLSSLGAAHRILKQPDAARAVLEQSIGLARRIGSQGRLSTALSNLALVEVDSGSADRAMAMLEEATAIDRQLGDAWALACDQGNLAAALLRAGRAPDAQQLLASMIDDVVGLGDTELTADTLERLAATAAELGADARAARLSGSAERLREVAGVPINAPDLALLEHWLGPSRARVPATTWEREVAAGREQTLAEAVTLGKEPISP